VLFRSTDRLYGTTDEFFGVVECGGCRLIRLHPWPDADELRRYYPENYWFAPEASIAARLEDRYRRFVLRDHVNFVLSALNGAVAGPVLDVGCGGALFGRLLREANRQCLGLDFSHQAATVGSKHNGVPVVVADLSTAPFPRASFAAITMFHVLEHLYHPAAYVKAAAECLKPGGKLIVQVPNAASWQFKLFRQSWNGIDIPRHLIDFRARDIDALLARCGFEVLRHKYFSLRDNPAGLATTLAPSLDPMARRIRNTAESSRVRLLKDLVYLGLVGASIPFTLLEAACRSGSTVMVEARRT
jgi:SAM-dependent methyltransferase